MSYYTEEQKKQLKEQADQLKTAILGFAETLGEATASSLHKAVKQLRTALERVEKDLEPAAKKEESAEKDMKQ